MPSWKTLSVEAVRGCVREPVNFYCGHARDGIRALGYAPRFALDDAVGAAVAWVRDCNAGTVPMT